MSANPTFISDRVSYVRQDDRLSIVITQQVERKYELLLLTRLLGWIFCGAVFLYYYLHAEEGTQLRQSMLIVLAFWIFFFIRFGRIYVWRKWGRENLLLEDGMLSLKKSYGKYGKANGYILGNVTSFDILPKTKSKFGSIFSDGFLSTAGERLAFDYFNKSIVFGKQLSDSESTGLHKIISQGIKKFRG